MTTKTLREAAKELLKGRDPLLTDERTTVSAKDLIALELALASDSARPSIEEVAEALQKMVDAGGRDATNRRIADDEARALLAKLDGAK